MLGEVGPSSARDSPSPAAGASLLAAAAAAADAARSAREGRQ